MLDRLTLTEKGIAAMAEGVEQVAALPIRSARSATSSPALPASRSARCACRWASSASSTRHAPNVTADAAAVPEIRQRRHPARRLGSDPQQPRHRRLRARRPRCCRRPARNRRAGHRHHRSRRRRRSSPCAEFVDVIVPRGGKGLISRLLAESRVPMIQHLDGNCHVYRRCRRPARQWRSSKRQDQRYGTCNTAESLLVARSRHELLPPIAAPCSPPRASRSAVAPKHRALVKGSEGRDRRGLRTEFLAPIISVKVVAGLDEAIAAHQRILRTIPKPSSAKTTRPPCASCARLIRVGHDQCLDPLRRMALSTASVPRSASPPTRSTPEARSGSKD